MDLKIWNPKNLGKAPENKFSSFGLDLLVFRKIEGLTPKKNNIRDLVIIPYPKNLIFLSNIYQDFKSKSEENN